VTDYDFILDSLKYSFSSANSYETCKHGFRLTYIEAEERIKNAFSDYGNLIHKTLEKYFTSELEVWDLLDYYINNFGEFVQTDFPPYPAGMRDNYYQSGLEFFDNFEFDKSKYEIIFIEEPIESEYHGIKLIVKPDLILKEIETGKYILIDYKTAKIKSGKNKIKQLEDYKKQFYLYCQFLWLEKNIKIDEIHIWFIRDKVKEVIVVDPIVAQNTLDWFEDTIHKIKQETEWSPNNTKENAYFCSQICSVRSVCKFIK
jgi:hypothetical protein